MRPLFNLQNPEYTGKTGSRRTQESGHEGALSKSREPVHTPVVGSVTETERKPSIILSRLVIDDSKYVDEEVVEQEGQKGVAKKSRINEPH